MIMVNLLLLKLFLVIIHFPDFGFEKDEELLELCYESMADIFPGSGAKVFLRRSRVWKLINNFKVTLVS